MRTLMSVVTVLCTIAVAAPLAQESPRHTVDVSTLEAAVERHVARRTDEGSERASVLRVLDRAEVRAQAERFGIDLRRASTAVAALDPAQLNAVASRAADVEDALAGGQSKVVISTTTIIIGLLVLILLIVALD
jgi:hypothetical protein